MVVVYDVFKERKSTYSSGGKDSLVKIIDVYFAAIAKESFSFGKKIYNPLPLQVSPTILRDFICHSECGACCRDFTLDYLPNEPLPYEIKSREVILNNNSYEIYTDFNDQNIKDK